MSQRTTLTRALLGIGATTMCIAALAGCGGDDDALSEEEFLSQGNAICMAGNEKIEAAVAGLPQDGPPTGAAGEEFFAVLTASIQEQIDDIAALEAPDSLADDADRLVADAQAALDAVEEQGVEAAFSSEEDPFADVNAQSEAIGLTACAE